MSPGGAVEVWGGLECSRVRIGDEIRDQILETGHRQRLADLDLIAGLGIRTLRYPVLWETVCQAAGEPDWGWHDVRLERLGLNGISPIAGLVHHGSGPSHCDVLDPDFPRSLADHAAAVAQRYPWIESFTPVNEPMTTARFSGLYGHWYPHGRDEATCFRIAVAECRAIAASMKAIRNVNAKAKLVQTEDIGRVFATPLLRYQSDHENERRWLALDLLAGRVDHRHPLQRRLLDCGVPQRHLAELVDEPCPPDVIGIDQYLTSDRFLDHQPDHHPGVVPGGNGRHAYVDVAAARAGVPENQTGFLPRIEEAWARYGLPIALTEVHNGCTRDEQLRWLMEGWNAANAAREQGIDVRAVSVWSLFGAMDWNSLLTRRDGFYEPGAFDIRFDPPRPTAIAAATRELVRSAGFDHAVLARSGWWKLDARYARPRSLLVTGSPGMDRLMSDCCAARRLDVVEHASDPSEAAPDRGALAVIHAVGGATPGGAGTGTPALSLVCRYPATGDECAELVVEADQGVDAAEVVHAFLDLVIDGASDRLRMTKAQAGRQYAFERLAG